MDSLDMSALISPKMMAEALYLGAGADALATLEGKIETGGHEMSRSELRYAKDVCRRLQAFVETESELVARKPANA